MCSQCGKRTEWMYYNVPFLQEMNLDLHLSLPAITGLRWNRNFHFTSEETEAYGTQGSLAATAWDDLPVPFRQGMWQWLWKPQLMLHRGVFFSLSLKAISFSMSNPGCSASATESIRVKIAHREIKSWILNWTGSATRVDLSKKSDRVWVRILPRSLPTEENKGHSQQKATGGPTILLSVIKNIFLSTAQLSSFILLYPLPSSPKGFLNADETTGLKPPCHLLGQFFS